MTESQVDTIGILNTLTTTLISVASGLLSLAAGLAASSWSTPQDTPEGIALTWLAVIVGVLGGVVTWLSVWTARSKNTTWNRIKEQSRPRWGDDENS